MKEVCVTDEQTIKEPVIHRGEDNLFLDRAQLPVTAAKEALTCHSSVKREAAPVGITISAGEGVEHAAHQGLFFIQKADELTRIKIGINKLVFFFFSVVLRKRENPFHRPSGSGELLSSGSQFADQFTSASMEAIIQSTTPGA